VNDVLPKVRSDDLLLVLSDHGMTDSGSHGGASESETSSFLYGFSPAISLHQTRSKIDQIDICPTVSLLFGFPIPLGNVGTAIPDFFPDHLEQAKAENEHQFSLLLADENMIAEPHELLSVFRKKWATFNLPLMIFGLFLIGVSLLFLPLPRSLLVIAHSLSLFSDSIIFGENLVVQFFLGIMIRSIPARLLGLFGKCREDTHRRICQPHLHIKSFFNYGPIKLIGDSFIGPLVLYCFVLSQCDLSAEVMHFLSLHAFFALGHQFTFSDIAIEAGFAFGKFHPVVSPICVFVNTFLGDFLANALVKDLEQFQEYRTMDLFCITAFAIYGRRHLMVWQVIAPRFLFQCVLTLITDVFVIVRR
jgi:hypothetical protein